MYSTASIPFSITHLINQTLVNSELKHEISISEVGKNRLTVRRPSHIIPLSSHELNSHYKAIASLSLQSGLKVIREGHT